MTSFRFITQNRPNPQSQYDILMNTQRNETLQDLENKYLDLDNMYMAVILKGLTEWVPMAAVTVVVATFKSLMGSAITIREPLSARELGVLLSIDSGQVRTLLKAFREVLDVSDDIGSPVRVFHQSFPEFLTSQQRVISALRRQGTEKGCIDPRLRDEELWVDADSLNHLHLNLCWDLMEGVASVSGLTEDICKLKRPGNMIKEVSTTTVERHISPTLRYACKHWASHFTSALVQNSAQDHQRLLGFLRKHLLHWLEAMSCLSNLNNAIRDVHQVYETLIKTSCQNDELCGMVADARQFVGFSKNGVEKAPLQVYSSAIVFAPQKSIVRRVFRNSFPAWLSLPPKVDLDWDACTATLEGHSQAVWSVAFSPDDSRRLVSGSTDWTVKLWDTRRNAYITTLKGHIGPVWSVAFSPDSRRLASGSGDGTIKLWDTTTTGACAATLEGHRRTVWSVAFSPDDSRQLASGFDDGIVKLWDTITGACTVTLKGHFGPVRSLTFLPDLRLASSDGVIKLWNTTTSAYVVTLENYCIAIGSPAFSPDSGRLASGCNHGIVKLWDTTTGTYIVTLEGHTSRVECLAFSPDSRRLASGSNEGIIKLWDTTTGTCTVTLEVGTTTCYVAFGMTSSVIHTSVGTFKLDDYPLLPKAKPKADSQAKRCGIGLSQDFAWVLWDSNKVLWLPPAFRGSCTAMTKSTIAIGGPLGRVLLLEISSSALQLLEQV